MLKFTILGCGSSAGVPQICCDCYVCKSDNTKNQRLRSSLLIEVNEMNILIDTSPDFRQQALAHNIQHLDAILYTHSHTDHIGGADDVKTFVQGGVTIPIFTTQTTKKALESKFDYLFHQISEWHFPKMSFNIFEHDAFQIGDLTVIPIAQKHGNGISHGFRIGDFAYSTDVNQLDDRAFALMSGVKTWIIGCLRYQNSPTHCHLEKALKWAGRIQPESVILTHMCHEVDYDEISRILPTNMKPAYDGMQGVVY